MARPAVELTAATDKEGLLEAENRRKREQAFASILALAPRGVGLGIAAGILGPGTYRGGTVADGARIDGIGWPVVDGQVTFAGNAMVRGVVFKQAIVCPTDAVVQFVGCVFLEPFTLVGNPRVACSGCRFDGTANINNAAGAAIDVAIAGGTHTNGVAHVNVTSPGGETT